MRTPWFLMTVPVGSVALLAVLPLGCGVSALLAGRFEEPQVTLVASKVEAVSRSAASVRFEFLVSNPNPYPLRVQGLHYHLSVNGSAIASGDVPERVALPARGSASMEASVTLDTPVLTAAAADALMTGEIPYVLEGTLGLGTLVLRREIRFVRSSVLRLNLPLDLARATAFAFVDGTWQT